MLMNDITQILAYGTAVLTMLGRVSYRAVSSGLNAKGTLLSVASAGVGKHIWDADVDVGQVYKVSYSCPPAT